jgi:hypothetical protein
MNQFKCFTAAAFLIVAGCASAPDPMAANESPQAQADAVPVVAAADADAVLSVDTDDFDPGSVISCREMLKMGSNVIQTYCMSRDDWKRFERRQEREAQEMLRVMQGSAFR